MDDGLKHLDEHADDIRELVDSVVQSNLLRITEDNQLCPKCVAVTLLEWAAYAATTSGATVAEVMSAVANGAILAEDEEEGIVSEPPVRTRH